jgi:hypothetical protein
MIESPFRYEKNFTAKDYETLGKLWLRWSHIDHVLANCLKRLLRLLVLPVAEGSHIAHLSQCHRKLRIDPI